MFKQSPNSILFQSSVNASIDQPIPISTASLILPAPTAEVQSKSTNECKPLVNLGDTWKKEELGTLAIDLDNLAKPEVSRKTNLANSNANKTLGYSLHDLARQKQGSLSGFDSYQSNSFLPRMFIFYYTYSITVFCS